ncbi:hypothetical protein SELMODRAFT_438396 [Selaginella moellendorffii]|uniref:GTD-binding domain-containing protein n=1 Tax=Selaginella moellendorffii TaxID=88036 RepID=D8QXQ3_SELML|nr:uncharacterized protein LOC9643417 [Selaginella moellendorffii]EFJ35078.1 hypothetical protein SELMODRAFT_438396 [Selaginella moellendorffii]|eukprot:XP_002963207.1 uncharacterized protein LOC9643417 [Selaginella moellendorffii]
MKMIALACHEKNANHSSSMVDRYWTSSLVICPFVDFALACLVLAMATLFLVSRMTQLCSSLASCWSGTTAAEEHDRCQEHHSLSQDNDHLQQQVTRYESQESTRSCLTCDRSGRLEGICISCIMRVLGPRAQESSGGSGGLFLQEIMMDAAAAADGRNLVTVSSAPVCSSSDGLRRHVELLVDKLQLRITSCPPDREQQKEAPSRTSSRASPSRSSPSRCECLRREGDGKERCDCSKGPVCKGACECWRTREREDHGESLDPHQDESFSSTGDRPANAEIHQEQEVDGKEALKGEREEIESLYYELEQERNAAAVAANESMAMITRLQEEKACLLMEARQYQRMVEEKAFHDHKAITILKEMLLKREAEKTVLEEEIEIYRRSSRSGNGQEHREEEAPGGGGSGGEKRKSSSEEETSATIKAVEEERLSVLERVKRLEQQLQLLRGNESTHPGHRRSSRAG